ncbi:MAG: M23 family metallopeptidase, partial [Sphaerospermopsis sp. SIO1G2]|nr:M23 family metallopeptidase [Sphaerospermopsis sp. SIO1G2]
SDKEARGCYLHDGWAVASAGGVVAYSDFGGIMLDLDGDGDIGTGWVLMYWHLDRFERIQAGSIVATGQNLGHPSCEGGFSSGTHLHIARRYNGVWIDANGERPFVMDGWVSRPDAREYDGFLVKGDVVKEACICADEINEIFR